MEENVIYIPRKQKPIIISRLLAFTLVLLFLTLSVITGVIVYTTFSCASFTDVSTSTTFYEKHASSTSPPKFAEKTKNLEDEASFNVSVPSDNSKNKLNYEENMNLRLPKSMHPDSYQIRLIPFLDMENFTFHGEVDIFVNVTENCQNVTLHSSDLNIDNVTVLRQNQELSIKNVVIDDKKQFLIIFLNEKLISHIQYQVKIKFRGVLNDLLSGFYRSSYKVNNETRWIATTQFQPTDARRAFPCFDEPAFKARFKLSIAHRKNMTSISNMRKIESSPANANLPGYIWDHYEESLPMSTYLVAFVVSDFKNISNNTFSIWARDSALSQTQYALQIGPLILNFYEDFFNISYPLPKIDMIAIPDFSSGAMENWGLITYGEALLLYQDKVSSKEALNSIAHVVAHELAHQWFGNLVTPIWWTDLWLNEGFATYIEYLGVDSINPNFKELDQFVINELQEALALDALKTSHRISIIVHNPDEINDIFDKISYAKGASLLRMMQNFMTMPVFQKGLNKYLSSRIYGNADQDDLWQSLTEQSHADNILEPNRTIKEIMDTWTLQKGYPLITAVYNKNNYSVAFKQEQFYLNKNMGSTNVVKWWVPLTLQVKNDKIIRQSWMQNEETTFITNVTLVNDFDWILVNVNQTGYYRVNYDENNWMAIINQLTKNKGHLSFDPKNRAQLLDDSFNLAAAGYLDYEIALNLSLYLVQEREFVPWKAALNGLDYLFNMFQQSGHFNKLKKYFLKLMTDFYQELHFDDGGNDDQLVIYSRMEIYRRMCQLHLVRGCIIKTVQLFQNWKNSPNPDRKNDISENMRGITYCTAISVGGEEEWNFLWERYLFANVENEKRTILMALGCVKEIWILNQYLEWAVTNDSEIRKQDSALVFAAVATNSIGQQVAYRFLKNNWNKIKNHLGESSLLFSDIVRSCTHHFNTQVEVDDFNFFLDKKENDLGVALRTVQQAVEQGIANVKWMNTNFKKIVKWLDQN